MGLSVTAFTIAVLWASHGALVDNNTIFELDGNALDPGSPSGTDWDTLNPPGGSPNGSLARVFLNDPAGVSIFTQGGSKDYNDISDWKFTTGSSPDKDEIVNAYAAAYNVAGDLVIYFGADRYSNDGDANIGFWFLQSNVNCTPNPACTGSGSFTGNHVPGDILAVSEFVGGGDTPVIKIFRWVGTGGNQHAGTTNLIYDSNTAKCVDSSTGANSVCGIVNAAATPAPWPYAPKPNVGSPGTFPAATFFEGGINLSTLLGDNLPCFSRYIAETRSSSSIQAILKDFVVGSFATCGISIAKSCTQCQITGSGTQFTYSFNGLVTNSGFGTLYNVEVSDDAGTPGILTDDITYNLGELLPGVANAKTFGGTFNSTTQNPAVNRATVKAAATVGGSQTVTAATDPATCPACTTNPGLTLTKLCETKLEVKSGLVAVRVDFNGTVTNNGNIALSGVTVKDDNGTPANTSDDVTFPVGVLAPNATGNFGPASYFPSLLELVNPGRATFANTVTATGTPALPIPGVTVINGGPITAHCLLCPSGTCPVNGAP